MIFKIHYGLWHGGLVGIIPFMFNYAVKYCNASATEQGILFTILPFVALLAKPIACSLADRYAAHRQFLLLFMFLTVLGYGSLAIYPFFKLNTSLFWALYCTAATLGNTSMCVVNSLGDSLAINSCTRKDVYYGSYRLWGPFGSGLFGALWGFVNNTTILPPYTPGILTMILIIGINSLFLILWQDDQEFKILITAESISTAISPTPTTATTIASATPNSHSIASTQNSTTKGLNSAASRSNSSTTSQTRTTNTQYGDEVVERQSVPADDHEANVMYSQRIQRLKLLWLLMRQQKSILVYVLIFIFCGVLTSIHWQFYFQFLNNVAGQEFTTIAALVLPVQSLGGELIFFVLAGKILSRLGASATLVLCLLSFAARYLLYAYVIPHVNIYWILPVELLQGPAFGLMYCVLTNRANAYSLKVDELVAAGSLANEVRVENSLHATLQGLLGASFEGLGLGLGALIGGLAYDIAPTLMWQIAGFSALVMSPLIQVLSALT